MTPDEKIVKCALDLQGIDLDRLMIADSAQILEAFKWLKQNVSGWKADEEQQPRGDGIHTDINTILSESFKEKVIPFDDIFTEAMKRAGFTFKNKDEAMGFVKKYGTVNDYQGPKRKEYFIKNQLILLEDYSVSIGELVDDNGTVSLKATMGGFSYPTKSTK